MVTAGSNAAAPEADFPGSSRGSIIVVTLRCDRSHWGSIFSRAGQELVMASHPVGPMPPSEWNHSTNLYTRSQMMALLRAGVIALALLGVLALIVLA
ncbi:hypothetical protein BEL07_28270 [Mycolicibacterium grossiae]|uniref:Uncharacterized protein n=1 Tax=Mycolicibacterium grossiae TaxID=1552759 RepID=A0A1E8PVT9_9MYCO|nr:hypothetical protein BEL07_28270 [Mycolicibacterium grossiae]